MRKDIKRVVAGVVEKDGKVLIAQRPGKGPFAHKWEFPGGKVKKGEEDREALVREIEEELGIVVHVNQSLGETSHEYDRLSVEVLFFRCSWDGQGTVLAREHQRLAWVKPSELGKYDFLEADVPMLPKIERLLLGGLLD